MRYLSEEKWSDALDRIEKLLDSGYSLKQIRKIAEGEPYWGRGRCIAEILSEEFEIFFKDGLETESN